MIKSRYVCNNMNIGMYLKLLYQINNTHIFLVAFKNHNLIFLFKLQILKELTTFDRFNVF